MLVSRFALRLALVVTAMLMAAAWPGSALAQTQTQTEAPTPDCTHCEVYAAEELNLRQAPDMEAVVLRIVPTGAPLLRGAGPEEGGYAPVTYDGVPGWVVALALVSSPSAVGAVSDPAPEPAATTAPAAPAPSDERETLEPLLLRSGPSVEAEPVLTMPQGAVVTLTREGAENGYVTVAYEGTTGWAYADLLAEVDAAA